MPKHQLRSAIMQERSGTLLLAGTLTFLSRFPIGMYPSPLHPFSNIYSPTVLSLSLSLSLSPHPNKHQAIPPMEDQGNSKTLSFIKTSTTTNAGVLERGRRIKMAAEMGLAESSHGRHWSRALQDRLLRRKGNTACGCQKEDLVRDLVGEEGDDEVMEIARRVKALQKIVPGGEDLAMDTLFEETADYIEALQRQVNVMRALASLLGRLEKEKRYYLLVKKEKRLMGE